MPNLYGKSWTRKQIQKYAGATWQTGAVRKLRFAEGPEDGVEVLQFDAGNGLQFNVLPHRALDIAGASFCGASLCYHSHTGEAHPAYYDPQGIGFLKTFYAGLLTTCGLSWAGAPCDDDGQQLGLHGRVSHIPARQLKYGEEWVGNAKRLFVSGEVRESHLFGPNLVMTRTISTEVGSYTIRIEDTVRNDNLEKSPHMMLYHINLGFPVLSESSELVMNSSAWARDPFSASGLEDHRRFSTPTTNIAEQVFYHDMKADSKGFASAALVNPSFNQGQGLGVQVRYRKKELFRFAQWKNQRAGMFVCGLEPCNCRVQGRNFEREEGTLEFLKPGEERSYIVEIRVLPDNNAIETLRSSVIAKRPKPKKRGQRKK